MVSISMPTLSPNQVKVVLVHSMRAKKEKALTTTLATKLITPSAPAWAASRIEEYCLKGDKYTSP